MHEIHHNDEVHHLTESVKIDHLANWKVVKYAEEVVSYGVNYFMKVVPLRLQNLLSV